MYYPLIDEKFAQGIVNLFFWGYTVSLIEKILPPFEFKKLDINKSVSKITIFCCRVKNT